MTLMILLEVEEKDFSQKNTVMQSTELDAQPQHNLCFCPETDLLDRLPSQWIKT